MLLNRHDITGGTERGSYIYKSYIYYFKYKGEIQNPNLKLKALIAIYFFDIGFKIPCVYILLDLFDLHE